MTQFSSVKVSPIRDKSDNLAVNYLTKLAYATGYVIGFASGYVDEVCNWLSS